VAAPNDLRAAIATSLRKAARRYGGHPR